MKINILNNYRKLNNNIKDICKKINRDPNKIRIVAVSKTQPIEKIQPLLKNNHMNFGENRLEEAKTKWSNINKENRTLHFIGALQSKKVAEIVRIFDIIETLDSETAAKNLSKCHHKETEISIQINIGEETQKRGIVPYEFESFLNMCKNRYGLHISGAMCMPPVNKNASVYFRNMKNLCNKNNIFNISMGMSSDYEEAITHGSTNIRVGSLIFGERN